ncbi:MAG: prepilin-type N-terminal cleavage/methylation domain-containing protein [Thermoguttaceae bacterium]
MIDPRIAKEPGRPAEARLFEFSRRLPGPIDHANTRKSRRGFSLVELLVVLSVSTAMLMVAMSVLYLLKQTQVASRQRLDAARMLTRLSDRFRADAHGASRLEWVADDAALTDATAWKFTLDRDTTVVYEIRTEGVRRLETGSRGSVRDDYRLPPRMAVTITPPAENSTLATLRLEAPNPAGGPLRRVRVEAVLGLEGRHSSPGEGSGK